VHKGQVLVELESGAERAAVQAAQVRSEATAVQRQNEVRLEYATQVLSRSQRLEVSEIISESQLDEAESTRDLAQLGIHEAEEERRLARAQLEQARALLALRQLESPIDGVVVRRMRESGELATEQAILELASIDPLHVEMLVPSEHFGRVMPGMRAVVRPDKPIGGRHEARVVVVDPIVDAASGTFRVRAELSNPDGRIPAGLECKVELLPAAAAVTAVEEPIP
jgi:RND family efflux transporter MFP subunit